MNPAVPANACLDGREIAVAASEWRLSRSEQRTLLTLAGGGVREQLADPGVGYPMVGAHRRFTLSWSNVGAARQTVGELYAVPGRHQLILWRPEELAYLGDESREIFALPNGWRLAVNVVAPPAGLPAARFAPAVRVGRDGEVLDYSTVDEAVFAGASPPAAGEVWFNHPTGGGGAWLRLAAAPAAGELVYVSVVPEYQVLVAPPQGEITLREPLREPRDVVLIEI